jgi:hypothetical protein
MLYGVYIAGLDDFEIKLLGKKVRKNHLELLPPAGF